MSSDVGQYGLQGGTTALTMVPPAAQAIGDRHVIWVQNKLEDKVPSTPSGWTLIDSGAVGTGAAGSDLGQMRITAFERDAVGSILGNTAVTITAALNSLGGGYVVRPGAGETFGPSTMLFASDTSSGTGFSAAMGSNQGFQLGDWAIQVSALTHGSPGLTGRGFTIPGCTLTGSGGVPLNSAPQNTTGNHQYTFTDRGQVTAGAQTSAATASGTTTTATTGGAAHIRLFLAGTAYTQSPTDAEGLTDSISADLGAVTAEAEGLTDSTGLSVGRGVSTSEVLGLADTASQSLDRAAVYTETEGLTDTATPALGRGLASTEPLVLSDSVSVVLSGGLFPTDALGLSDAATVVSANARAVSDAEGLSDSAALAQSLGRSDAEGLTDQATVAADRAAVVTDLAGMVDAVFIELTESSELADALGMTDQVMLSLELAVADGMALTDMATGPSVAPDRDLTLAGSLEGNRFSGTMQAGRYAGALQPGRLSGETRW